MAGSTSSTSAGSAAWRRAGVILGLVYWVLAPVSAIGQDEEEAASPQQQAEWEIAQADVALKRAQRLRQHPDFAEAGRRDGEEIQTTLERARRLLAAARSGLESAVQRQSGTGFSDAALLARRAAGEIAAYEEQLQGLFREIEEERSPPPPPVPAPEAEEAADTPVAEASGGPAVGAGAPEMTAAPEAAEALVAAPDAEPPLTEPPPGEAPLAEPPLAVPPPSVAAPTSPPASVTPPPVVAPPPPVRGTPAPRTPPRQLRRAADAYFAGDYEQTVALLTEARFSSAKARAHALLLRAAARYAIFLLGGGTDYALRGLATEDVAACRRADPELAPDEEMFSPRFRDFFAATR